MGRPKQLLPLGGRPLLQHVIDAALASRLDEVIVVLGHRAEEILAALDLPPGNRLRVVLNADYREGQSTSLRLGLRAANARASAVAVLLGDQPGMSAALIDRMATAPLSSDRPAARPVYRLEGRRVPGHPVLLARRIWAELDALHGDEGARVVLAQHPDWLLEVAITGEPPIDVDTPSDYVRVERSTRDGSVSGRDCS
jgi:molybdenum cofactor cytidylyltransferase